MKPLPYSTLTALNALPADPIIIVECEHNGRRFIMDRDMDRANWRNTVQDIASGEIENVCEVWEIGRDESVTEDIAREVLALARKDANGEQLPYGVREFCHEQLGTGVCA